MFNIIIYIKHIESMFLENTFLKDIYKDKDVHIYF